MYVALIMIFLKMILTTLSVSVTAIPIAQCSMLNAQCTCPAIHNMSLDSLESSEASRSSLPNAYWQKQLPLHSGACVHRKTNTCLTETNATNIPLIVPAMMLGGSPSQPPRVCPMVGCNICSVQAVVHQVVTVATAIQEVHILRCHISVGPRAHMGPPHCLPLLCSFPLELNDLKRTNSCCSALKLNDLKRTNSCCSALKLNDLKRTNSCCFPFKLFQIQWSAVHRLQFWVCFTG